MRAADTVIRLASRTPVRPLSTPRGQRLAVSHEVAAARWLTLAALVFGLLYLAFFAYHAALTITFPYDLDWGEGYVLNDALRLGRGEPIYRDIQQFPMVRSPYPPLFLALDALLIRWTGPTLLAGRLLSTFAAAASAWLAYRIARANGAAAPAAGLAGLLILGSPHVYQWAVYSRVDMLAVAFSLAALLAASGPPTRRRLGLAALLSLGALLTKQTALAAPGGIALALLLSRPRRLGWYLGPLLGGGAMALGLLSLATEGEFIRHVVLGNAANPLNLNRLIRFEAEFSLLHPLLLAGALGLALAGLRRWRPTPLAGATLAAWVMTLSVANETSSVNYFLEFIAIGAAAAAVAWTRVAQRGAGLALLGAGFAALQLALLFHIPNTVGVWPSFFAPHGYTPTAGDLAIGREVDAEIARTSGPILAEPAGFAVRNQREVLVQPLDLRAEQLRGRWDSTPLREALRERRFELVVLSYELLPLDVLDELKHDYRLERTLASPNGLRYSVYRPRY